jgi:zinc finger SWIM domain-containing protein 3
MGESKDTEIGEKEHNSTRISEFDRKHGFLQFNGKHYKDLSMKDLEGVHFKTIEEAEKFYTYYSLVVGFSVRKHKLDMDRDDPFLVVRREWVCSKEGKAEMKAKKKRKPNKSMTMQEDNSEEKKKKSKNQCPRGTRYTRDNCLAAFTIWYSKNKGVYYTTRFKTEHNHECAQPEEVHFLRSHRSVKEHDIAQVESLRKASVKTSGAYELMVHQAGGYKFVGFTIKDLYNKLDAKRRLGLLKGDAHSAICIMNLKASNDPEFYCKFQVDVEGRLANIFWRDGCSLAEYNSFGDVLIFDSTYKTNLYGKPLVVFVGTNHHRATVLFGCALLVDETVDTYTWVLNSFLASMKGKKPISVLTDGDGAMRNAIRDLMPEARHRLCAWHIGRNIGQNIKGEDAQKSLGKFIFASLSEDEFEADWHSVVAMHKLENNLWLTTLYKNRHRWAQAFFRGHFFGGMCSTQRCEGIHSKFKKEIGRFTRLYEVVPRMDKTISRMRNRVVEDNFRGTNSKPLLDSHMRVLEEQISKSSPMIFLS